MESVLVHKKEFLNNLIALAAENKIEIMDYISNDEIRVGEFLKKISSLPHIPIEKREKILSILD